MNVLAVNAGYQAVDYKLICFAIHPDAYVNR